MYTAQIQSTGIQQGVLSITIQYSSGDGTDVFTENITTPNSQDDTWLDNAIMNRLNTLNDLWSYNQNNVQNDQALNNSLTSNSDSLNISPPISPSLPVEKV